MAAASLVDDLYPAEPPRVRGQPYPSNPLLLDLLRTREFRHDEALYPVSHTLSRKVAEMTGGLIIRKGFAGTVARPRPGRRRPARR